MGWKWSFENNISQRLWLFVYAKNYTRKSHELTCHRYNGSKINAKRPSNFNLPPNWLWILIQILIFYQLTEKRANFEFLTPQHPLPQIGTWLNFDPKQLKSPKSTSSGLLLNIHNKFPFPSWIWRGVMHGTNSKNRKTDNKTIFLGLWGAAMGLKSRDSLPGTFRVPIECTH